MVVWVLGTLSVKEAPEEGKVGIAWCQWLSIYWGVLCCSLILSMIIGGRKYWHQLLLLSLQLEFPATPVQEALTENNLYSWAPGFLQNSAFTLPLCNPLAHLAAQDSYVLSQQL